jgi:flagellar basal-body rod modification protein FlgD
METGMISATSAAATASSTAAKTPSNTIDKNGFLQLLVAQLKNQDPTSGGQDPNAMVQQLTSFSSLEQAQQTNTLLSGMQAQISGLYQAQATSLVGKTVVVNGSSFNLKSGTASLNLNLDKAANVTLMVKDASGRAVSLLPQGHLNAGANTLTWNGLDANGNTLPDGAYQVIVSATGDDGKAATFGTSMSAKVDGVAFQNGAVYLTSSGVSYALADVLKING